MGKLEGCIPQGGVGLDGAAWWRRGGSGAGERGNAFTQNAVLPFEIHSRASCSN